jgi:hypothetical protein
MRRPVSRRDAVGPRLSNALEAQEIRDEETGNEKLPALDLDEVIASETFQAKLPSVEKRFGGLLEPRSSPTL